MASAFRACCTGIRANRGQRSSQFLRQPQSLPTFSSCSNLHTGTSITSTRNHVRSFQTCSFRLRSETDVPSEPPPTDFNKLNMLGDVPPPSTSVDVCMHDGFGLNSGITIKDGDGALLVNGEAFSWRPWKARESLELTNKKGQFDLPLEAFGLFDILWPRPGKRSRAGLS